MQEGEICILFASPNTYPSSWCCAMRLFNDYVEYQDSYALKITSTAKAVWYWMPIYHINSQNEHKLLMTLSQIETCVGDLAWQMDFSVANYAKLVQ